MTIVSYPDQLTIAIIIPFQTFNNGVNTATINQE